MSSNTATTRQFPAALIKNIRACAAVISYNLLLKQDSMKLDDQWRFCYNAFHGNEEKNICSQIQLLVTGQGRYGDLYDTEEVGQVTNRDTQQSSADTGGELLVLKSRFSWSNKWIAGVHFTVESLSAPTKARPTEKITGRNIYNLAMATIRNIKKAMAVADEFLNNGDLPSGQTWDNLYHHLYEKGDDISKEKAGYTGWIALPLVTHLKDYSEDVVDVFSIEDKDGNKDCDRRDFRKKRKTEKDEERSIAIGSNVDTPTMKFGFRGMSIESKLQSIELVKLEESQKFDDIKIILANHNTRNRMLLEERQQAIKLVKEICPTYDKENVFWLEVHELSKQIKKRR